MTGRQARGEARTEAILDAAERLTVEVGAGALSLRGVAAASGIHLGHLQHYFGNREALVRALLGRILRRSEAALEGVLSRGDLRGAIEVLLAEQRRPGSVRLFWELWALAARDRGVARAMRAFYDGWVERAAKAMAARASGAGLPVAEALVRARLMVFCLEGLSLTRSGVLGRRDPALDAAARELLAGLTGLPAAGKEA